MRHKATLHRYVYYLAIIILIMGVNSDSNSHPHSRSLQFHGKEKPCANIYLTFEIFPTSYDEISWEARRLINSSLQKRNPRRLHGRVYRHFMCVSKVSSELECRWRERKSRAFPVERKQRKERCINSLGAIRRQDVNMPWFLSSVTHKNFTVLELVKDFLNYKLQPN